MMNDFASNNDGGEQPGANPPVQTARQAEEGDLYPQDARAQLSGELDRLRGRLASPDATESEKRQFRELSDHLHWGGPVPESMRSTPAVDPASPHDPMRDALAPAYEPAASEADYRPLVEREGTATEQDLAGLKQLALAAQLPASVGEALIDRLHHHSTFEDGQLQPLDEAGTAEFYEAALEAYGGDAEKFHDASNKARAYLQSTLPPAAFKQLDDTLMSTSAAFDPWLLNRLATLYDVRFGGQ